MRNGNDWLGAMLTLFSGGPVVASIMASGVGGWQFGGLFWRRAKEGARGEGIS